MYISYEWVKQYLASPPSREEAMRLLNETGLETEFDGDGLEIEYTVNRSDAMCHYGVARELAVKMGGGLVEPTVYEDPIPALEGWRIESLEPDHCSRYMGLKIANVKAEPSPQWLVDRLTAIDQTCHNVLVDLTNFLLWEFSHPSHAFDANKIKDNTILIRFGKEGEELTTLDGRNHKVDNLLCIADAAQPIALAGVMGGQNSEVDDDTTQLLLELAVFRPATTRLGGRTCNIHSDARHRFERGVDRERMERVIRRFIYLLKQEQPQIVIEGLLDMDLSPFERNAITLRRARLDRVLGVTLSDEEVLNLLQTMDCRPETVDGGWLVRPPGYKVDVIREVDVIEEVIRFAGLDRLSTELPRMGGTDLKMDPIAAGEHELRRILVGAGLQETCTYAFLREEWDRDMEPEGEALRLRNPMNLNQAVMRRNILPNMIDNLTKNLNRGIADVSYFELGHVFRDGGEPHHLAMVLSKAKDQSNWWAVSATHPFYVIKGLYELLAEKLGWSDLELRTDVPRWLEPGEAVSIWFRGKQIGGFGVLAAAYRRAWKLESPVTALELDLSFLEHVTAPKVTVPELATQPGMQMDMAFVVDRGVSYERMLSYLQGLNMVQLESCELFDLYEGKSLEKGKKSLGFRFRFQAPDRTLTSDEVTATMDAMVEAVKNEFGATIRM